MSKITQFYTLYKTAQILGLKQKQVKELKERGEIPYIETPFGDRFNVGAVQKKAVKNALSAKMNWEPRVNLKLYKPGRMAYVGR